MTARLVDRVVTVMGSPEVGKSSLTIKFVQGNFEEDYTPTILKKSRLELTYQNVKYSLTIQDTAGLDPQSSVPMQYVHKSQGFILVYSITERQSFETVQNIYDKLVESFVRNSIPVVLVGNKCDLQGERKVSFEEGEALAKSWNAFFVETSAKQNSRVSEIFYLCLSAINKDNFGLTNENNAINEPPKDNPQNKCLIS